MAIAAGDYVIKCIGAGAGSAGTTEIKGARLAGVRFNVTRREVPGKTGPKAMVTTYTRAQVFVETPSPSEAIDHCAKTTDETLKITYAADGGNKILTVTPVSPAGTDQIRMMAPEEDGPVQRSVLLWDVLETDAVAVMAAFSAAAAGS